MAIPGERFLRIGKARWLIINSHALERIEERAGIALSLEEAFAWFRHSRHLRYEEIYQHGYRPAYQPRLRHGVPSWYFLLPYPELEMIAVIRRGEEEGEYEWVTTYSRNHRNTTNEMWATQPFLYAA